MANMMQPNIPKLTATNYGNWSIQMKVLLGSYDNWDIVESGFNEPADAAAEAALPNVEKTTLKESRRKNTLAFFMIFQGVDEPTFDKIADVKKAKDAWEILQKSFQGVERVKKEQLQVLRGEFENIKMEGSENIDEYVTSLKTVTNEMKRSGESLNDFHVMKKLVGSFQPHEQLVNQCDDDTRHLENVLQSKVFVKNKPRSSSINISGGASRNKRSLDNIFEASRREQTTVDYSMFCLKSSEESDKSRRQVHYKIVERVHYNTKEILDDLFMKSFKWGVFHKMKDKLEMKIRV